ncbi:MAG: hypothetical protein ACE5EX_04685 [Phycisphaerae bacterium]
MTTTAQNPQSRQDPTKDTTEASLAALETLFDRAAGDMLDSEIFEAIEAELRRLHARIRIHHSADQILANQDQFGPELAEELNRLRSEHPTIIGLLDRLIRLAESIPDRTLEDKEVFILRGREVIAFLRRHEAEEDRLFYLSVWRETGGES